MLHGKGNFSFFIIHVVQREGKRKERGKTKYSSPCYGLRRGFTISAIIREVSNSLCGSNIGKDPLRFFRRVNRIPYKTSQTVSHGRAMAAGKQIADL